MRKQAEAIGKAPEINPFILDLIEACTPETEGEVKFSIVGHTGVREFRFRSLLNIDKIEALNRLAAKFAAESTKSPIPEIGELYDQSEDTKHHAWLLAELSIEPKLHVLDLLALAKRGGLNFKEFRNSYNRAHTRAFQQAEVDAVEAAKNESDGTPASVAD